MALLLTYRLNGVEVRAEIAAVVTSESHGRKNDVTKHPVEEGAQITDHVRSEPKSLVISGCASDTPILSGRDEESAGRSYKKDTPGPAQDAWELLNRLSDEHPLLDVVTTRGVYKRMVIQSLEAPTDGSTGEALNFTCTFIEVRTVATQSEALKPVAVQNGNGKQSKSKQQPKVAPKAVNDSIGYFLSGRSDASFSTGGQ